MSCPPKLAEAIEAILSLGLLRIRSAAWAGDAARCAWEADHLHNLPGLLTQYSPERLTYYWQVERPGFLQRAEDEGISVEEFTAAWNAMNRQVEAAA
jgi:hypothetical protein